MPLEVLPFRSIRYDSRRLNGDLSPVLAPPYDVLESADKDSLLRRSDRNIVAVDLPHLPPKSAGPREVYDRSAALLGTWRRDGTLMRESTPAMYVYHQEYEHAGRRYTRRKFIGVVRLQSFSAGIVLPHEQTFGGPKEDRLSLMRATRCQLSPIFGLYDDPGNQVNGLFSAATNRAPDATATLDGVVNRVWVVTDETVTRSVTLAMTGKRVYIADGHHRYGTALLYRDALAEQNGTGLAPAHPANFVMFVLAGMDDPGCLILPYHRALGEVDVSTLLGAWREGVSIVDDAVRSSVSKGSDGAAGVESPSSGVDLVLHEGRSGREVAVRYVNRGILRSLEPKQVAPWYDLDYAYLHRYLIDELYPKAIGRAAKVHYLKSASDAKATAREHEGVALLVKATPMAHLRAVSEAGGLMPQKSTYFHPKLATGITMYPLDE